MFLISVAGLAALRKDDHNAARFCGAAQARGFDPTIVLHQGVRLAQVITMVQQSMEKTVYETIEAAGRELEYEEALAEAGAWLDNRHG